MKKEPKGWSCKWWCQIIFIAFKSVNKIMGFYLLNELWLQHLKAYCGPKWGYNCFVWVIGITRVEWTGDGWYLIYMVVFLWWLDSILTALSWAIPNPGFPLFGSLIVLMLFAFYILFMYQHFHSAGAAPQS